MTRRENRRAQESSEEGEEAEQATANEPDHVEIIFEEGDKFEVGAKVEVIPDDLPDIASHKFLAEVVKYRYVCLKCRGSP